MKAYMQRMGRSLMLPVAVLPAASLLVGIANWIVGTIGASPATTFLMNGGLAILNNLALLFAVGLALECQKIKMDRRISWFSRLFSAKTVLALASIQAIKGFKDIAEVNPAFNSMDNNVFVGIVAV